MPRTAKRSDTPNESRSAETSHRLYALLQTMRCIAQHEDRLCGLLENLKAKTPGHDLRAELRAVLDDMPGDEYEADVEALRATL